MQRELHVARKAQPAAGSGDFARDPFGEPRAVGEGVGGRRGKFL
jgi:hypothetical protein